MNRRSALGLFGAIALASTSWVGWTVWAGDRPAAEDGHLNHDRCAKACMQCLIQCEADFQHCVDRVVDGRKEYAKAMNLCVNCGDLCAATGKLCARHSALSVPACEACTTACDMCAVECEKFPDDGQMVACAKACRECAQACRALMKHGHEAK